MDSPETSLEPALTDHVHVEVRQGAYLDSVTLLQVSRAVGQLPGVLAAQVAMATELNVEVLRGMGFDVPDGLDGSDLVVAVRADSDQALTEARAGVDGQLADARGGAQVGGFGGEPAPRTTAAAVARGGADLALVSVAGPYAAAEAFDALASGVSVMVFSDNVSVADEVALKMRAAEVGALVMGPDCGTAIVGGAALGFANVVRPGSVGVVAASGTGAQQVTCLLDAAGVGLSHCLGVGGRDLSAAVAGRSTRAALAALDADPQTTAILVVSKPPAAEVLADLQTYAASLATPVTWATLGSGRPDLTAAVEGFLGDRAPGSWPSWGVPAPDAAPSSTASGSLRGLFCGGTLADEAMLIATPALGPVRSNIPLSPELALGADLRADGHVVIDFGDDGLTQGRAHPMIDPTLRNDRLRREEPTRRVGSCCSTSSWATAPTPTPPTSSPRRSARRGRQRRRRAVTCPWSSHSSGPRVTRRACSAAPTSSWRAAPRFTCRRRRRPGPPWHTSA